MFTKSQITWAQNHDWYVGTNTDQTAIQVCEIEVTKDWIYVSKLLWFDNFEALRTWAGY